MENIQQNELLKGIFDRRSVRKYSDKPVEMASLELLTKAAMAAPSGKNLQPWRFVIVTERQTLNAMAEVLPFAKMLNHAPSAIVVCGDISVYDSEIKYWEVDCSAATQNLLLAAHALGLGAVWTATYPYPERMEPIAQMLELPENIKSLAVIPIGYPAKDGAGKDKTKMENVHYQKW